MENGHVQVPAIAATWDPHRVLEACTGFQLSRSTAVQVQEWSEERREQLIERLAASVIGSLCEASESRLDEFDTGFGSIDSTLRAEGATFAIPDSEVRQQLLYLPRIVIADPFARFVVDHDPGFVLRSREYIQMDGETLSRPMLDYWLESLCALAPALRNGCVKLSIPYKSNNAATMLDARDIGPSELRELLSVACLAYAEDMRVAPSPKNAFELTAGGSGFWKVDVPDPASFFQRMGNSIASATEEQVWSAVRITDVDARRAAIASQNCGHEIPWECAVSMAMRGLSLSARHTIVPSLATNIALGIKSICGAQSSVSMVKLLGLQAAEQPMPRKQRGAAERLTRFRLPGISNISIEDILLVRQNEKVFADFQRAVGSVLGEIESSNPMTQEQFELDLAQAMDDVLTPQIDALEKGTRSSFIEKSIIPSTLALGAGAIALSMTGTFPAGGEIAASITPATWLMDKLHRRYRRSGRNDRRLIEAFITLQSSASRSPLQ